MSVCEVFLDHNIQAKQGHFGITGKRHFLWMHGFFQLGFRQGGQAPHLGGKHPVHFLHGFFLWPPVWITCLVPPQPAATPSSISYVVPHLHTFSALLTDLTLSSSTLSEVHWLLASYFWTFGTVGFLMILGKGRWSMLSLDISILQSASLKSALLLLNRSCRIWPSMSEMKNNDLEIDRSNGH